MPTFKNITISLRTSAAETAPLFEYPPPPGSPIRLEQHNTAAVYVPAMPKLTFWIAYHAKSPIPEDIGYYVFKLYMEGRLVVTWGAGDEDDWKGKTMFGVFENKDWPSGLERRAFAFGDLREEEDVVDKETDHHTRFLEVRVLRAVARRRVLKEAMRLDDTEVGREGAGNVELFNAGMLQREDPKRFYEYALRDKVTEPYAVFKYYYRTWGKSSTLHLDQLKALDVLPDVEIEECEDEPITETGHGFEQLNLKFPTSAGIPSPNKDKPLPALPVDRPDSCCSIRMVDEPSSECSEEECMDREQDEAQEDYEDESFYEDALDASPIRLRRLSFPPKTRFDPVQVQASRGPIKTPISSRNASPAPTLSEYCDASSTVSSIEETTMDRAIEPPRHTPSPVKGDESRQESREMDSGVPNNGGERKASFKDTIRRVVSRHKHSKSS